MNAEDVFSGRCDFIRVENSPDSDVAVLVFSHVNYPKGKFAMTRVFANLSATRIYVNCLNNSWYQTGLGEYTKSIEETTTLLQSVLNHIAARRTIAVGMSMGGYAAILFGVRLACDAVLAFTAEIILGVPYGRSFLQNSEKQYNFEFRSLSGLIQKNKKTVINAIYGVYDPIDLSLLWPISVEIENNSLFNLVLVSGDHQVTNQLDINEIITKLLTFDRLRPEHVHAFRAFSRDYSQREILFYAEVRRCQDTRGAQRLYDHFKANPEFLRQSGLCWVFANTCFDLKYFNEAESVLSDAIELDPFAHQLRHSLGMVHLATRCFAKACEAFSKAIELHSGAVISRLRLANTLFELKKFNEAKTHFEQVIIQKNDIPEAFHKLARIYEMEGNESKAQEIFEKANQLQTLNINQVEAME